MQIIDSGSYGTNNDYSTLPNSVLGEAFEYSEIDLPEPEKLQRCCNDPSFVSFHFRINVSSEVLDLTTISQKKLK